MGQVSRWLGSVYIDANVVIYTIEKLRPFLDVHRFVFERADKGEIKLVTSQISLNECLAKPVADGNVALIDAYLTFVADRPSLAVVPTSRAICIEAAKLRAAQNLKLPDALHVATALQSGCAVFLGNDRRIKSVPGLTVEYWDDLEV